MNEARTVVWFSCGAASAVMALQYHSRKRTALQRNRGLGASTALTANERNPFEISGLGHEAAEAEI